MSRNPSEAVTRAWIRLNRARDRVLGAIEHDLKAGGCPPLAWYDVLLELSRAPGRAPAPGRNREGDAGRPVQSLAPARSARKGGAGRARALRRRCARPMGRHQRKRPCHAGADLEGLREGDPEARRRKARRQGRRCAGRTAWPVGELRAPTRRPVPPRSCRHPPLGAYPREPGVAMRQFHRSPRCALRRSSCHAAAQAPAPGPLQILPPTISPDLRIVWEVKNRFRLFRREADFLPPCRGAKASRACSPPNS